MSAVKKIAFREVARPLRITFSTAKGWKNVMRSVIIRVTLADGSTGLGECPTSLSSPHETIPAIEALLKEILPRFRNMPIEAYDMEVTRLRGLYGLCPMTVSGLEVALFRAWLASRGLSEHAYWGGNVNGLTTDITIPFLPDKASLLAWLKYTLTKKFTSYKLKVSGDQGVDRELISVVYETLRDNLDVFALRLDGNQGYTEKNFLKMHDFLCNGGYQIELFEQPLSKDDYRGLREIKKESIIPIILDETVITGQDAQRIVDENLADGVNIKIAKSGIAESRHILEIAKRHRLKLMIGCMTETMVGLSVAIRLAAGTGSFNYIDLDAIFLLHHKNCYDDIRIEGPHFELMH
jgi:L-alanine-DL-glutamate epimerase-like enolase superfamily enzyme